LSSGFFKIPNKYVRMDDFLDNLKNLPQDLRESKRKKDDDWMPPTEEYSETFSEDKDKEARMRDAAKILDMAIHEAHEEKEMQKVEERAQELARDMKEKMDGIRRTKADRVDMQDYVMDKSKQLAQLAIEAVEGLQGDVVNSADGKLAQAYATLIGTASKALDTINTIAQEQSRREHDKEMEEIKFKNKLKLAGEGEEKPKSVTNNLNIVASREEMFRMIMEQNRGGEISAPSPAPCYEEKS